MAKPILIFIASLFLSGIIQAQTPRTYAECKRQPRFVAALTSFDATHSAFSTSERTVKGLVLIENQGTPKARIWQHQTWRAAGWLGPITLDKIGNVYTAPAPLVNVLDNPTKEQNTIWRVNDSTGVLQPFMTLPTGQALDTIDQNPYGILAMIYDCDQEGLYVSSVAGSTRKVERGRIFYVDLTTKTLKIVVDNIDAMGICLSNATGEKRLYFGSARTGDVFSVAYNAVLQKPRLEFSLDGLGVRGDDKPRRLRINPQGDIMVNGMEFNFNLQAPTEKIETIYRFHFNGKTWVLLRG